MNQEKWIEVSTVAKRLNVSASTVYRLIDDNILKSARFGSKKAIRVRDSSVVCFEKSRVMKLR